VVYSLPSKPSSVHSEQKACQAQRHSCNLFFWAIRPCADWVCPWLQPHRWSHFSSNEPNPLLSGGPQPLYPWCNVRPAHLPIPMCLPHQFFAKCQVLNELTLPSSGYSHIPTSWHFSIPPSLLLLTHIYFLSHCQSVQLFMSMNASFPH
jgi:hypothetical protein